MTRAIWITAFIIWLPLLVLMAWGKAFGAEATLPEKPVASNPEDDKWKDWSPPPMHTDAEMIAILNSGVHICEISQSGPCEGVTIVRPEAVILNQIESTGENYE